MTSPDINGMFNPINSSPISELSTYARKVLSKFSDSQVLFNREVYLRKKITQNTDTNSPQEEKKRFPKKKGAKTAEKDAGPFHNSWHFFVFLKNTEGRFERLHYNREYHDNSEDVIEPYILEFGFTEDDIEILQRSLTSKAVNAVSSALKKLSI